MPTKCSLPVVCFFALLLSVQFSEAGCLTGKCHQELAATRYVHGPVAAELAGGMGCVACHVPAGTKCTATKKGSFKPMASAIKMCQLCHSHGTGTQHSSKKIDCLKCHDPHGSEKSADLKR